MLFTIWVLFISALGGALNIYTILNFSSNSANHTGNISRLSIGIAQQTFDKKVLIMIGLFFLGSLIAGVIFHEKDFLLQKKYGVIFIVGGIILYVNYLVNPILNIYFIPMLLGLQNGMFLTYNGALCRFTHVTGYISDAAYEIGRAVMRSEDAQYWKIYFYLGSVAAFMAGGLAIAELNKNQFLTITVLSISYILNGIYFFMARGLKIRRKKVALLSE